MTKTWCVGGKRFYNTIKRSEHEKRKPKTKKLGKNIKGKCSYVVVVKARFLPSE